MASELYVDKITGKTGTSAGAPITISGDTATLGSGVTNNAGVASGTIGSSATFPAGHVLQVKVFNGKTGGEFQTDHTSYVELPNTDWESDTYPNITITGGNKIFVSTQMMCLIYGGGADNQGLYRIYDVTNSTARGHEADTYSHNANAHDRYECAYVNIHALFTQSSSSTQQFTFSTRAGSGGSVKVWHEYSSMTLMEIKS